MNDQTNRGDFSFERMQRGLMAAAFLLPCCLPQPMWAQSSSSAPQGPAKTAGGQAAPRAEVPFACNLKALTRAERKRYDQLVQLLAQSVAEQRELPDGYAF